MQRIAVTMTRNITIGQLNCKLHKGRIHARHAVNPLRDTLGGTKRSEGSRGPDILISRDDKKRPYHNLVAFHRLNHDHASSPQFTGLHHVLRVFGA